MIATNDEHPSSKASLAAAKAVLHTKVSDASLIAWITAYGPQVRASLPPRRSVSEIVLETHDQVVADMQEVRNKAIAQLKRDDKLSQAPARDLAVITGIMDDHVLKREGLSPEDTRRMLRWNHLCSRLNLDAGLSFDDMLTKLEMSANMISAQQSPKLADGDAENR